MQGVDEERAYAKKETARKLRRIADAIEFEIELETHGSKGEIEIEMRWDRRKGH